MAFLIERLAVMKLKSPKHLARHLLAHLHSGDLLRLSLPKLLRISAAVWLFFFVVIWFVVWPEVYKEFERWGLLKAFFAQIISIATAFLVTKITLLRAGHLEALPPDDFVTLRALSVLCRWFGETTLVSITGMGLSSLLQPVSALLGPALNTSPEFAAEVSSGSSKLLLASAPLSLTYVSAAVALFLLLYSVATTIDVLLAVEFNTRAERVGKRIS